MSYHRKCAVNGCYSRKSVPKHKFPRNDPLRFQIWINSTGNPKLLNMSRQNIYKSYVMCDVHFESSCHVVNTKKLNVESIPTLFLPKCE